MKKLLLLLSAFVLVFPMASCHADKPDFSGYGDDKEYGKDPVSVIPAKGFKLMSFNVRYQNSSDEQAGNGWSKRREGVYEMLRTEQPLLMGVQECLNAQRYDIVSNVPKYDAIGIGRDDGKEKGEMMAIFYLRDSVTILDWGTFWLSTTPDQPGKGWDAACNRTCTWARCKHKRLGKEFFYFNTHLDHKGTTARIEGMKLIVAKMEELNPGGLPCILTADFNSQDNSEVFTPLQGKMQNARRTAPRSDTYATYNGFTSANKGESSIIDHIFYSGFTATEYKTVRDGWKNIDFISDHFPVYAILTFQ